MHPLLRRIPLLSISTTTAFAAVAASASTMSTSNTSSAPSATSSSTPWPTQPYTPRHSTWPYQPADFTRQDPSSDSSFYSSPRFVTHIDDHAIGVLRRYYGHVLPRRGRILDFCSSWVSHYPREIEDAAERGDVQVVGMGMSGAELQKNEVLNAGRVVWDLNRRAWVPDEVVGKSDGGGQGDKGGLLDAATCVVSVDYLTSPREVLESLRTRTKEGGTVHLIISNRCFPTKAVGRWLQVGEEERLQMVGDYLWFAGWRDIEIVTLCDGSADQDEGQGTKGGLRELWKYIGMGGNDPLWVVRGRNLAADEQTARSEL